MGAKETLHRLIDHLPKGEVRAAQRYLEYLCARGEEPVVNMLLEAPKDDEPTTAEENQSVEEAWEEYRQGKGRSLTEVRKDLVP